MVEKSPFSELNQVGIIVRDMDAAIKHYESMGIGPFTSVKSEYLMREMRGKPVPPGSTLIKVAVAKLGEMEIELLQPVAEGTDWMEFLKKNGEGINHLGFRVDDIAKEEDGLVKKGFEILYRNRIKRPDGTITGSAYIDTGKVGGVLFEIRGKVLQ